MITDIKRAAEIAHGRGACLVADNSKDEKKQIG